MTDCGGADGSIVLVRVLAIDSGVGARCVYEHEKSGLREDTRHVIPRRTI